MDAATRALLTGSLRQALRAGDPRAVDAALAEVGWAEALQEEGPAAVALLFTEQGAANAASGALDDVLTAATGRPGGAFVLPGYGLSAPPAETTAGGRLRARGLGTSRLAHADTAVVVTGAAAHWVSTKDLRVTPVTGVDPELRLVTVEADGLEPSESVPVDWPALRAAGQLAVAYELVAASRAMLELACDHARSRVQFGRPIASFQAVRHRLADSLLAIETAAAAVSVAAERDAADPLLAGMAKAVAGRGARTAARHCQQVLAGIGFTAEHAFHRHLRRILTLDGLLGTARGLTRELGTKLIRTRRVPPAPPL